MLLYREEVLEFAVGGDLVDKPDEQIDVEVWDYHWVNKPGNLTWYDEWYRTLSVYAYLPCPVRTTSKRSLLCYFNIIDYLALQAVPVDLFAMQVQCFQLQV